MERIAGGVRAGPFVVRFTYPAKDGHVSITHLFGSAAGPATHRLMQYVYDEGFCDEATRDKDWVAYTGLLFSGEEPIEEFERVKQLIARFTATKTKAELFRAALDRGLLLTRIGRFGYATRGRSPGSRPLPSAIAAARRRSASTIRRSWLSFGPRASLPQRRPHPERLLLHASPRSRV
jgi:hypothetical protein